MTTTEETKRIKMRVVEHCTYVIELDIPADANPEEWVSENGEAAWVEVENMNDHFVSCDERWVEVK